MKKLLPPILLAAILAGCTSQVGDREKEEHPVAQRKAKISDNLKLHFPQLRQADLVMGDLEPSDISGLDRGSFTVNDRQTYIFMVDNDDTRLFLLSGEPIDVSRSSEDVAAALADEERVAAREAQKTHAALVKATAGWPVRGNPGAPVTIVEFSDFQCPYCARAYKTVEEILEKYPGEVKFIYAHFPLPNHPWAKPAAIASVCAAQLDPAAFWKLHDSFFEEQNQIDTTTVLQRSKEFILDTGIDLDKWSTCAGDRQSAAHKSAVSLVEGMAETGTELGVEATPGFFVNGYFLEGSQPIAAFESLIAKAEESVH